MAERNGVRRALGGLIPASCATSMTGPFFRRPARDNRMAARDTRTRPRATASRAVTGLAETSTMRAASADGSMQADGHGPAHGHASWRRPSAAATPIALEEVAQQDHRHLSPGGGAGAGGLEDGQRVGLRVRHHVGGALRRHRARHQPASLPARARRHVGAAARAVAQRLQQLGLRHRPRHHARALQAQQRGPHEQVERHLGRHGVAGQPEDERVAAAAEDQRRAGLDGHLGEEEAHVEANQHLLHQVEGALGHAAGEDEHVGVRPSRTAAARACGSSGTGPRRRASAPAQRAWPGGRARCRRGSGRGRALAIRPRARRPSPRPPPAGGAPPARGPRPTVASTATVAGSMARPASSTFCSRPHLAADGGHVGARLHRLQDLHRAAAVAWCGSSPPAARRRRPSGSGAPVMMGTAWPGGSARSGHWPARTWPATASGRARRRRPARGGRSRPSWPGGRGAGRRRRPRLRPAPAPARRSSRTSSAGSARVCASTISSAFSTGITVTFPQGHSTAHASG